MEVKKIRNSNLLTNVMLVLTGILITSAIFAVSLKFFKETGIWVGLIFLPLLSSGGFYYTKKGSGIRIVIWTMLVTFLLGLLAFFIGLGALSTALG